MLLPLDFFRFIDLRITESEVLNLVHNSGDRAILTI